MNISVNKEQKRYIVDAMFGKFGRFLRLLGFDTEIADSQWNDSYLLKIALETQRILITRDFQLYQRCNPVSSKNYSKTLPYGVYFDVETVVDFLTCFFKTFDIKPEKYLWDAHDSQEMIEVSNNSEDISLNIKIPFKPRCTKCNSSLKSISEQEAKTQIFEGTSRYFHNYWQCSNPNCKKIYWIGKHWMDILRTLKKVAIQCE
ncbi:Mut7-C RNAse domain-containing protein [Candidatus Harpocratesius sp.]